MRSRKIHLPHVDIPVSFILAVMSMLIVACFLRDALAR